MRRDAQESRDKTIHNVVAYAFFGDVKSYVTWLASRYPEITEEGLHVAKDFFSRLAEDVAVQSSVRLSPVESARLLLGDVHLSQRAYKAFK